MDGNPHDLKLILMILLAVFALFFAGLGTWFSKKAVENKNENVGVSAFVCFIGVALLLAAAGAVAGFQNIFK